MNYSTPGVNKPTLVERLWAWLMLALMMAIGAITFGAAMLIHEARAEISGDDDCAVARPDPTCPDWAFDKKRNPDLRAKPIMRWYPSQHAWQCNDIHLTVSEIQPNVWIYDIGGSIWGGSQFAWDHGVVIFNGRPCVPLS